MLAGLGKVNLDLDFNACEVYRDAVRQKIKIKDTSLLWSRCYKDTQMESVFAFPFVQRGMLTSWGNSLKC